VDLCRSLFFTENAEDIFITHIRSSLGRAYLDTFHSNPLEDMVMRPLSLVTGSRLQLRLSDKFGNGQIRQSNAMVKYIHLQKASHNGQSVEMVVSGKRRIIRCAAGSFQVRKNWELLPATSISGSNCRYDRARHWAVQVCRWGFLSKVYINKCAVSISTTDASKYWNLENSLVGTLVHKHEGYQDVL